MKTVISSKVEKLPAVYVPDPEYDKFLRAIKKNFRDILKEHKNLFTVDTANLWDVYLTNIPYAERQHHNCNCCRKFIENYGGLVYIDDKGKIHSALWDIPLKNIPSKYIESIHAFNTVITSKKIQNIFLSNETDYGVAKTGDWKHISVIPSAEFISPFIPLKTIEQVIAEKKEDFNMLQRALSDYSLHTITQAVILLASDHLYRSEKVLGMAKWFQSVKKTVLDHKVAPYLSTANNLIWMAVANAPVGFCHIKSSMIGTLLEDIENGLNFDNIKRKFDEKMNPMKYQRPVAAPTTGNIKEAEKAFEKLGLMNSLKRRYLRLSEIPEWIWQPKVVKPLPPTAGIFSHLLPKAEDMFDTKIPPTVMTWDKFTRTVLPEVLQMEVLSPSVGPYTALVTAEDQLAPPILQWDTLEERNPVSWYVYAGGSSAPGWKLEPNKWTKVNLITPVPHKWNGLKLQHHTDGVVIILDGARETRTCGSGLFPEILKSELRPYRATIEAHSKIDNISGMEHGNACGLLIEKSNSIGMMIRVRTKNSMMKIQIDRWD